MPRLLGTVDGTADLEERKLLGAPLSIMTGLLDGTDEGVCDSTTTGCALGKAVTADDGVAEDEILGPCDSCSLGLEDVTMAVGDDDGCWDIAPLGSSDPSLEGFKDTSRLGASELLIVG